MIADGEIAKREPSAGAANGPEWQAAIDFGIDVALLEENLLLTVSERFEQLLSMTRFVEALELAREKANGSID